MYPVVGRNPYRIPLKPDLEEILIQPNKIIEEAVEQEPQTDYMGDEVTEPYDNN